MDCRNSRELMHEWLEELLEPAEAAAISSHVAGCRPCQSYRDTAGQLRGKVRAALTTPTLKSPFPHLHSFRWTGATNARVTAAQAGRWKRS